MSFNPPRAQNSRQSHAAYRSAKNDAHLERNGFRSRIRRRKPPGKPMPVNVARANAEKSKMRSAVGHVFGRRKGPMALFIRMIGLARARAPIGLANLVYTMKRYPWLTAQRSVLA